MRIFEPGDQVTIKISKEEREWGYNKYPDGTVATVVGFTESIYGRVHNYGRKPGVYENTSWLKIDVDGVEYTETSSRLTLTDLEEYEQRKARERAKLKQDRVYPVTEGFLRDLPELPFWEWDIVRLKDGRYEEYSLKVNSVNYDYLGRKTENGSDWPIYHVGGDGWYTAVKEDEIEMVRRGQVWKYYHNEPIQFANLEQEAKLHNALGLVHDVRNPANGKFSWTKDEVLQAIKDGVAHGLTVGHLLFGSSPCDQAVRFIDEELGKRVANETLKGFDIG